MSADKGSETDKVTQGAQNSDSQKSQSQTLKDEVYAILTRYPSMKPKALCKFMDLDYHKYRDYVSHVRSDFVSDLKNSQGLKRLNFHHWNGWIQAPDGLDRVEAVKQGWVQTRAKNRYLLWKDRLGRLEWHESRRIRVWLKKPANKGKALQLLANGFLRTELIFDIRYFTKWAATLRFRGASAVIETGQRLPYLKIDLFKDSNGITIKLGDKSHPSAVEIDYYIPRWAEELHDTNKALNTTLRALNEMISSSSSQPPKSSDKGMVV
jgi:hypothetical protein